MDELLRSWGVSEEVVGTFADNGIQVEHFQSFTDVYLKELCPKVCERILIKDKILEYLESVADTVTNSERSVLTGESSAKASDDLRSSDQEFEENSHIPFLSDVSIENIFHPPRPAFPDFELKTLLSVSHGGRSILNIYDNKGLLDNIHRNRLTDIIVRHLFTRIVNW